MISTFKGWYSRSTTPAPGAGVNHFLFVDALRGIAALYVVVFHMALVPPFRPVLPPGLADEILVGGTGVTLFFVISAFTLSYSMRERAGEPHAILCFYVRRIFRIAPLFYAWLLLSICRDALLFHAGAPSLRLLGLNLFFAFNFFPPHHQGIVWASWTLGVEMMFYLIFPLIFLSMNSIPKACAFVGVAVLAAFGFHQFLLTTPLSGQVREQYFSMAFPYQIPVFALGLLTFLLFERFIWRKPKSKIVGVILLTLSALLWLSLTLKQSPFGRLLMLWRWYPYGLAYVLLACGLAIFPVKALVNRLTVFYGKVSYSLYLNHPTVVFLLSPVYRRIYWLPLGALPAFLLCYAVTLVVLTPISYMSYQLIERPGNRAGRWLIKKYLTQPVIRIERAAEMPPA